MHEPILHVADLRKNYGALKVTDGVVFSVGEGQIHALIGPNGAGKTTLIHQLSGSLKSDSGSIRFKGMDITHMPMPERVHLGLARSFQITSVLERFNVLENVAIAIQARSGSSFRFFEPAAGEKALNDEALAILDRVHLADRAYRMAGALSHGEKRQLEFAIALATGAKFLLLDEPLAGTSHEESALLIDLMRSLRQTHTLVLIEHDMDAVFSVADCVSVLVYGKVIASGPPAVIRNDPDVRAAYLGEEEIA